jgi:phospholipid/cholesterol/gamma-HCH transport system substrate-binding protein
MSTITQAQRSRLGIFLFVGAVVLFFMIAIPVGLHFTHKDKTYYAYFSGESMSGLEEGSPVKYHGVPIGKVARIAYDPANLTRIKVIMKVQSGFPMKKDMYAQTWAMGITGLNYLDILGGTNKAPLLPENSEMPTKVSMLSTLTGKVDVIMDKVELLINHLNTITEPDSLASVKKVLENLVVVTGDTRRFFRDVGPEVQQMSGRAGKVVLKIDSITGDIHSMTKSLSGSLANNQIGNIMSRVDSAALSLKNLSDNGSLLIRQSREDVAVSMQNLREALENANQLIQVLSENPSLLLKNEPQKERDR